MYTHGANERGSVQTGLMQKNRLFEYLKTKMYDNKFLIFYHFLQVFTLMNWTLFRGKWWCFKIEKTFPKWKLCKRGRILLTNFTRLFAEIKQWNRVWANCLWDNYLNKNVLKYVDVSSLICLCPVNILAKDYKVQVYVINKLTKWFRIMAKIHLWLLWLIRKH